MKAISLKAGRSLNPSAIGKVLAAVSNLRNAVNPTACLSVAVIATLALFVSLAAMDFTAVLISGTTALTAAAVAPASQKGGEL